MTTACIFPGQGSQEVGMLADLRAEFSGINERLHEASVIVDEDLIELVEVGPETRLNQTAITQPVLLAVSVALFECWVASSDQSVAAVAGHSLGEYSALTAAGVLTFADAIKLVHERGRLMQEAVPEGHGAMAAVMGLDLIELTSVCDSVEEIVAPANINAPGQIVISGTVEGVESASALSVERGAQRIVRLPVSVPSHCELMNGAAEGVAALLDSVPLSVPRIPLYHNVDAKVADGVEDIRTRLVSQLSSPVQWSATIAEMTAVGCTQFIECGPGRVLTGLMRRIDRALGAVSIGTLDAFRETVGDI